MKKQAIQVNIIDNMNDSEDKKLGAISKFYRCMMKKEKNALLGEIDLYNRSWSCLLNQKYLAYIHVGKKGFSYDVKPKKYLILDASGASKNEYDVDKGLRLPNCSTVNKPSKSFSQPKGLSQSSIKVTEAMHSSLKNLWIQIDDRDYIDSSEITEAFKRLAFVYHPSRGGDAQKYKIYKDAKDHLMVLIGINKLTESLLRLEDLIGKTGHQDQSRHRSEWSFSEILSRKTGSSFFSNWFSFSPQPEKDEAYLKAKDVSPLSSEKKLNMDPAHVKFEITPEMKRHLALLQIDSHYKSDVTKAEINKAYKSLALKYHTDRGGDAAMFNAITVAKNALFELMGSEDDYVNESLQSTLIDIQARIAKMNGC